MTNAYGRIYLEDAMENLGEMLDFAVNHCNMEIEDVINLFISGGWAEQYEKGVPKYICGMTGTELFLDMLSDSGIDITYRNMEVDYEYTAEYWCGHMLVYYQWYTGMRFKDVLSYVTIKEILKLYPSLQDASETRFVNALNKLINKKRPVSRLSYIRNVVGISQRELADKSGVTLRMVQQYEQRAKDINKASVTNLLALSKSLGCAIEDLLEPEILV